MPKRVLAFLQVLLVIAFWSSSPPLIKLALRDLEAQEIAAMRYFGAFLVLLPWLLTRSRSTLQSLDGKAWLKLTLMGILGFAVGNTALFLGLKTLNATTGAFLMNGIPLITLIIGAILLKEHPGRLQWFGVAVALAGGTIYFWGNVELNQREGVLWLVVAVVSLASYGLFGRSMAKGRGADPIILTAIPMGIGAGLLLALDWPSSLPNGPTLGVMLWLTVVNSAFAFWLWNHALEHLQAFEISVMGNLMPIGTALISGLLLHEEVPLQSWQGMLLTLAGVILVGLGGPKVQPQAPEIWPPA